MGIKQFLFFFFQKKKKKNQNHLVKKQRFSKLTILDILLLKFHGLVLVLQKLIDVKGIDVAQPIWP